MKVKEYIIVLIIIIALLTLDVMVVEPNMVKVERLKLEFENIDEKLDGLKIVQISDLHFGTYGFREELVINLINYLKPDLIVITGDLINNADGIKDLIKFLKKLRAPLGIYCVYGNWDHWSGVNLTKLRILLKKECNVTVLVNEYVIIEYNGTSFYLIGVDDPHTGHDNIKEAYPKTNERFKILLAHSPEILGNIKGYKVNLILVGHTHGGQIVLPLIGPLFLPLRGEYRKYVSGLYKVNGTYMYVNRGLGTSIIPIRLLCSPEITLIRIRVKK